MKIEHLTIRGTGTWNEDALVLHDAIRLYGVLDGATSLTPFRGPGGETGGYLASRLVKTYLESLPADTDIGLDQALTEANAALRKSMVESGIDIGKKEQLWTTGAAIVRVREHCVEYAQTGDCMIIAVYADGTVRTVTRDQVAHIDNQTRRLLEEGIRSGMTRIAELRDYVSPAILRNKSKMNTLEGYGVLSGEPEAAEFLETGRINRILLKELLLVTDGLFVPKKAGEYGNDMAELIAHIADKGLAGYADWLLRLEADDPDCLRYPRFKTSDDKTAIRILF